MADIISVLALTMSEEGDRVRDFTVNVFMFLLQEIFEHLYLQVT